MKVWVYVLIAIGVAAGFYFRIMTFDPLSSILLGLLIWTQHVSMLRQQQLADLVKKSHEVQVANQKETINRIDKVASAVRNPR